MPQTLGNGKARTIVLNHESHKLHQEFTATAAIPVGAPCMLTATGGVKVWDKAEPKEIIGHAMKGATAANETVTLFMKGGLVIYCFSKGAMTPGMAKYDSQYTVVGGDDYQVIDTAVAAAQTGWVLDVATAANQLVRYIPTA